MGKFNLADLLNDQSKPAKAEQVAEIRKIPLCQLRPSSMNKYRVDDIEDLAANIEMVGLLHNLVVTTPDKDGIHDIISGERRYHACKMLADGGNEEYAAVNCRVEPPTNSETETELKLLFANAFARDLSDYEKTYQAARIKELLQLLKAEGYTFKGRMRDNVADMLGVSPAQMGRMESINTHLSDDFMEEFKAGTIGISAAYDVSTMPAEEQAAAHEKFKATGAMPAKAKRGKSAAAPEPVTTEPPATLSEKGLYHPDRVPLFCVPITSPAAPIAPAQSGPRPDPPAPTPPPDPPQAPEPQCNTTNETRSIDHAVCPACGCTFNPGDVAGSLDRIITTANIPCPHCAVVLNVGMSIEWICSAEDADK